MKIVVFAVSLQAITGYAAVDGLPNDVAIGAVANDGPVRAAANGGESVRNKRQSASYLELGVALVDFRATSRHFDSDNPIVSPYLEGALYWRALFAEAQPGLTGVNFGATLWQDERWTLDLITASLIGELNADDDGDAVTDAERTERLYERDSLLVGSGFRLSRYTDRGLLRFQLLGDIYDNNGFGARLHIGRRWLLGNWEARALVGASWLSDRTADYFFGIDPDEATTSLPAIEIDDIALIEFDISLSYPLSQHWVVHADATFSRYDGSVSRSALVDRPYDSVILARIGYVF